MAVRVPRRGEAVEAGEAGEAGEAVGGKGGENGERREGAASLGKRVLALKKQLGRSTFVRSVEKVWPYIRIVL